MLIRNFSLNQVELCDPVLENAVRKEQEYLRSIDTDRLLAGFMETAGIEWPATCYPGGWEDAEIAGHTLGHYLTALSQLYKATGAKDIEERLNYILQKLAECQTESGYLFASKEELFDRVEREEPAWVPWYTMHKIMAGLISAYRLANRPQALDIAVRLGVWVYDRATGWTEEIRNRVLAVEYGGMNDCLYELYKETGRQEFAEAASRFDEDELFQQMVDGKDVLSGKHANTTIPKFLGALNRYIALGESEHFYLTAARSFFDMVTGNHSYVTGGNSEWEHFRMPGTQGKERTRCNCETCNTHNMLKLAEGLYQVTGEKRYMDYYERTLLNAVLGSQNPETGMTMYFQPMAAGYFKVYSSPYEHFWCCTGTGMENFTKLNSSIYHKEENKLYVNLYLGSVLRDEANKLTLTQKTDLAHFDYVQFLAEFDEPKQMTFAFRVPEWTNQRFELKVNGEPADYSVSKGYILLEGVWQKSQQISLQFFPEVTMECLPDAPYSAAAVYGPFVLAAGLGNSDMTTETTGVNVTVPTKNIPVRERILVKNTGVKEWFAECRKNFVKKEGEVAFFLFGTDADGELLFTPYYKHYNDRYGLYFDYVAEAGLSAGELSEYNKKQLDAAVLEANVKMIAEAALYQEPEDERKLREKAIKKEKKEEKKQEKQTARRRNTAKLVLVHVAGALVVLFLLYVLAGPLGRVKDGVDRVLCKTMPGVAKLLGRQDAVEAMANGGSTTGAGQNGTVRYVEDAKAYVEGLKLPTGYEAFVAELSGKEYICVEGKGLRAYYLNEVQEPEKQYIYLESLTERAVFFWEYSFDAPESLCFTRGVHNAAGVEQYIYREDDTAEGLHLLDVKSLQEHEVLGYKTELALLADVMAYTEAGDTMLLDTVIDGVTYVFSVPQTGNRFDVADYIPYADCQLTYTLESDGIGFHSYLMAAGVYLGEVEGTLGLSGQSYRIMDLSFCAYGEEDYGDVGKELIIKGVSFEETEKQRVKVTGDLGEKLLVPVRTDVTPNTYAKDGFVKDEKGQYTYVENGQVVSIKGVDVSKYQETIDWQAVAADGVEFAMIRLGFRGMGTNGTCELDPYFKQNMEGARAAGIEVGVYFFTQATTVAEAKEEAKFVIDNLKGYDVTWPVVFDSEKISSYEKARANVLPRDVRTACAKAFLDEIKAAGYTPMLYAGTNWTIMKLDMGELEDYPFWYAYYGDDIYYPYDFEMWQYTSTGTVSGIKGKADLNISLIDYGAQ